MIRKLNPICGLLCGLILFWLGGLSAWAQESPAEKLASPLAVTTKSPAFGSMPLTEAEKSWLAAHPSIRIAYDGYFPPYSFRNEQGEIKGLAVDVMQLLAAQIGIKLEPSPLAVWKDLYAAAQRREVDVVATMGDRLERREWFLFTRPYIFKSLAIMVHPGTRGIESPADLAGKRVALVKNYQYVKPLIEEYPNFQPYYVDTMLDGLNAVAVGKADAAITLFGAAHYLRTRYHIADLKFAAIFEKDKFTESIGIRSDWPELASILNKALASFPVEKMKVLQQRWLGPENTPGFSPRLVFTYLAMVLGGITLLILGFSLWTRQLRRQVRIRTADLQLELTERKKAEEARVASEKQFRDVLENIPLIAVQLNENGKVVFCNDYLQNLIGCSREELLSSNWFERMIPDANPEVKEMFLQGLQRGEIESHYENPILAADGSLRLVLWNNTILRDASGRVIGTASIGEDVTARQQAEAVLRQSETRLRKAEEIAHIGHWVYEVADASIQWSDELWRIFGREAHSQPLSHELFTSWIRPDFRPVHDRFMARMMELRPDKTLEELQYCLQRPDGEERWVSVFVEAEFDRDANPERFFGTVQDITERKQTEIILEKHHEDLKELVAERTADLENSHQALMNLVEDLNEANIRLLEVDQLKSMFIASMSHELRTPLNSIIGFSSILLNEWTGTLNDEQKQNAASILRSGRHLLALINDIIDLSKIEAGKIEVVYADFDLGELLVEVQQTLQAKAEEKDLALALPAPLPELQLHSDRRRLLQALINLVSNAIKYTEHGSVRIDIEQDPAEDILTIAVIDTGIGIATEDQVKLFEPFSRVPSPFNSTVPGTGLGLYLTEKIVEDILQGTITVSSKAGQGSSFSICIPRRAEEEEHANDGISQVR